MSVAKAKQKKIVVSFCEIACFLFNFYFDKFSMKCIIIAHDVFVQLSCPTVNVIGSVCVCTLYFIQPEFNCECSCSYCYYHVELKFNRAHRVSSFTLLTLIKEYSQDISCNYMKSIFEWNNKEKGKLYAYIPIAKPGIFFWCAN